jgi:hypothetical protein
MSVNLVTRVRNFYIANQFIGPNDHDVQDGCATPGNHKLLRFDFLSYNAGTSDFVIGSPASRPDLFVYSNGHGHYHLKDFNEFLLFDSTGQLATIGFKQAFCAIDIERVAPWAATSPRFTNCNSDQGISAGWADVYSSGLQCQYIIVDTVPDGDYTLQSTTNAQHVVAESCFGDNTVWTGLRIAGNSVAEIEPPWYPEDCIPFDRGAVATAQASGRWKVAEGGQHWMLDTGTSKAEADRAVEVINHYRLSRLCFVGRPRCGDVSPMMYWLADAGEAPSGMLADEDCIAFDPNHLAVVEIGGRWKVVEGAHWLLDFGPAESNARAALHFIRKYGFDEMCFVGRPEPSMTYFKDNKGDHPHIREVDPRFIDFSIDLPHWWLHRGELIEEQLETVSFDQAIGDVRGPAELRSLRITGLADDRLRIGQLYGMRGLEISDSTSLELLQPVSSVDLIVAPSGERLEVSGYAAQEKIFEATVSDRIRQQEFIRVSGDDLDRVVLEPSGRPIPLLVEVRAHLAPGSSSS